MNFKKNFIAIDNEFFDNTSEDNLFTQVGTEGFALYSFLLDKQGMNQYCTTTIREIQTFFNRDYENRPKITYRHSKKVDGKPKKPDKVRTVSLLKDKTTIIKYITALKNNKSIEVDNEITTNINNIMIIKCIKRSNDNFTAISSELFFDYIHKIGHIGFSLLCLLSKLHNHNFGNCTGQGFANPSEEYICNIIKREEECARAYLYLLQKMKLVKIEEQPTLPTGKYDKNGREIYKQESHHYIVKHRLAENKYNLYNDN